VFSGWGWLLPCLFAATAAVALGAACDRWGRRTPVTVVALALGGALLGLEVSEPGATVAGIPTPTALSDFAHDLSQMAHVLHSDAVPVAPIGTALLLAALAAWATGAVSYLCATRLAGSLAPVIAPLTVFVTVSALGRGSHAPTTAVFGAGVGFFLLAQQRGVLTDRRARFHAGSNRAALPIAGAAAATVVVIAAALVAGPSLPGARSDGLIDYRRLGGASRAPGNLVVVTPLVDIRARLAKSPPQELFTVDSDHPSYWRIAGLDEFDGQVWGIAETESAPVERLASAPRSTATTVTIQARFSTTALAGPWVPVVYRPSSIDLQGARILPGSSTVIVRRTDAINSIYDVVAQDPAPTPAELTAARLETGASVAADLELPSHFPDRVRALARQVTASATTPYAQALALQNFLRDRYKYSITVPKGRPGDALVDFLFESKAGFCEQFAGAFAAMARSIGLPTRVAVGFTTGTPDGSGVYHVTTQEAHAWPEIGFAGLGWIRFEPTPGRFDPTAGNYTQTGTGPSGGPTTTTRPTASSTVPTTPGQTTPAQRLFQLNGGAPGGGRTGSNRSAASVVLRFLAVALASALAAALALALGILGSKATRRYRRRHAPTDRERITGAWDEALERLAEARIHRRPSSTPVEFAMREAPAGGAGDAGPPLLALAHLATTAFYAPDDPLPEVADDAWTKVRELERALRSHTAPRARLRRRLDPRVLRGRLPGETEPRDVGSADDALAVVSV
jgi:transglutaminase-like putative cysteine protease